jgi:hypothetical protein
VQGCRHSELALVRVYAQVSKCARAQKGPFSLLSMAGKCAQNKTHQGRRNVSNFEWPVIKESHLKGFSICLFVSVKTNFKGQLISKCPFGVFKLTKIPTKIL